MASRFVQVIHIRTLYEDFAASRPINTAQHMRVDFPDPDGPIIATNSPFEPKMKYRQAPLPPIRLCRIF